MSVQQPAILKPDCSGETSGTGCFGREALDKLMFREVVGADRRVIGEVERWRPEALVQVQSEFSDCTLLVDPSGALSPADWAYDLHHQAWPQPLLSNLP